MKYINKSIQISCDGGAATGKSTGAKMIAKKYKFPKTFLPGGKMRSTTSSKSTTPAPTPATGRSKSKAKSKPNAPNSSKNNSKQNRSKQPAANTKSLIPRPYHERARQKHMETIASSLLAVHTKYFRHNLSPVQSMTSFLRSAGGESVSRSLSLLSENARVLDITTY